MKKNYQDNCNNNNFLQEVMDSLDVFFLSIEPLTYEIIYLSPQAEKFYGRPISELLENPSCWREVIHPEDRHQVDQSMGLIFSKKYLTLKYRIMTPGDNSHSEIIWLKNRMKLVMDLQGKPLKINGVVTQIKRGKVSLIKIKNDKKILNFLPRNNWSFPKKISKNIKKYQNLFKNCPLGISITDENGKIIEANAASEKILGISIREHQQRNYDSPDWKIIRPDGSLMPTNEFASVIALTENRLVENVEMGIVRGEKDISWISVTAAPLPIYGYGVAIIYIDITERKKAEFLLKESEAKYRSFIEDAGEAILVEDKDGNIIEANNKAAELFGYSREELVTMPASNLHPIEVQKKAIAAMAEATLKGQGKVEKIPTIKKDKRLIWVDISWSIIEWGNSEKIYQAIFRDTTYQVQAEIALRESEERFRAIFERAAVGMAIATLEGRLFRVNQKVCQILGYTPAELLTITLIDITYPEDREASQAYLASIISGEISTYSLEKRYFNKKGNILWAKLTISLMETTGENQYLIVAIEDITGRKQAELALRESEERWQLALRGNNDGIWDWNLKTNECFYSNRWYEMLGYSEKEISKDIEEWRNRIHPEDINRVKVGITKHLKRQTPFYINEYRILCKNGNYKWILDRGQALWDEAEKPVRMVGSHTDITERKLAEEALRWQTKQEQLLRTISQHIRQSLNLSEILQTAVDEIRKFLQTDRVIIYRLNDNGKGLVMAESLATGNLSMLEWEFSEGETIYQDSIQKYLFGMVEAEDDIYESQLKLELVNLLEFFKVKAQLIMPILVGETLEVNSQLFSSYEKLMLPQKVWGLLIAHQCSDVRKWQQLEINLLQQLGTQLSIAIQQSQLYQKLEIANQELYKLANLDGLTQVANRRRFDEYLEQVWQKMAQKQQPLSLILCDIDFFKLYNDGYGHLGGDDCLKKVAAAINESVKLPTKLVARYGGEEFAIILPNTNSREAMSIAETIRFSVKALKINHGFSKVSDRLTLSLGIATVVPSLGVSPSVSIEIADKALYQAKQLGRNRAMADRSTI